MNTLRKLLLLPLLAILCLLMPCGAFAQETHAESIEETPAADAVKSLNPSHITWGLDVGASIDLGGNDMSTFDAEAMFGYRNSYIQAAGIGVGVRKAFGNEYTFIPLYAMVRTSFRNKPSLFFLDARAGYSFNTIADTGSQGGFIFSVGCGINLSLYKGIKTHIIVSYNYYGLKEATDASVPYKGNNIDYAALRIGVSF